MVRASASTPILPRPRSQHANFAETACSLAHSQCSTHLRAHASVEAPYSDLKGVSSAISGYIGGHVPNPTYRAVCDGTTGHAEAVRITYDPAVISFATLLDVFFVVHDPTTLNRQGADAGTQYRSAVFYHGAEQRAEAEAKMRELAASFPAPIVTELSDAAAHVWYPAEDYHQRYAARNPTQGYVVAVGQPKYRKAYAKFAKLFKD